MSATSDAAGFDTDVEQGVMRPDIRQKIDERREAPLPDHCLDDVDEMDANEYVAHFIDDGQVDFGELWQDLAPRVPSERIRLLFDWELWDYQADLVDDPSNDVVGNTGRQVGKTETAGAYVADKFVFKCLPWGHDALIGGDVLDTSNELFRRFKAHIRRSPLSKEDFGVTKDNSQTWEFETGARVMIGSLKNGGDNLRGKLPRIVVVDEAALVPAEAFEEVIRPMFNSHGDAYEMMLTSTPRGKSGYHFEAFDRRKGFEDFSPHRVPSMASRVFTDPEGKRARVDSMTWDQEYLGKFVEAEDAWIPTSLYDTCRRAPPEGYELPAESTYAGSVDGDLALYPHANLSRYLGVDFGRTGSDRTVMIDLDANGVVRRIYAEDESNMADMKARIRRWEEDVGYDNILVDEGSFGGAVVDFAGQDEVLAGVLEAFKFSRKSKNELYQRLKSDFQAQELFLPDHRRLESETTQLQYDNKGTSELLSFSHPDGGHDDFPDALALANYARAGGAQKSVERSSKSAGPTAGGSSGGGPATGSLLPD